MIHFQALGVRFTLPLLTLLIPPLAARLGMNVCAPPLLLALTLHEAAHILIAKAVRVQIREIRLLPCGGSARMENLYALRSSQLVAVASAGPTVNLLAAIVFAAMVQWKLLTPLQASSHIPVNLCLFFFNCLPVLPLDGGRILYALLQRPLGQARATRLGIWLGRIFSLALLLFTLIAFLKSHKLNLSFLFAAIFILLSSQDECDALFKSKLKAFAQDNSAPLPAHLYQLDANAPLSKALHLMRSREASWFFILEQGILIGLLDGRSIAEHIKSGGSASDALKKLPFYSLTMEI